MTKATARPWATMNSIEREPDDYTYAFRAVNQHDALIEALEAVTAAIQPIREGKRNGAVFGNLSVAEDTARAVLDSVRE